MVKRDQSSAPTIIPADITVLNQHVRVTKRIAGESGLYRAVMTVGDSFARSIRLYRDDERRHLVAMEDRPRTRGADMLRTLETRGVSAADAAYLLKELRALMERPLRFTVPHTVIVRGAEALTIIDPACTARRAADIRAFLRRGGQAVDTIVNSHYHPDHWGNNGRIGTGACPVLLHPAARDYLDGNYYGFLYRYTSDIFRSFDLVDVSRRLFGMPRGMATAIGHVHESAPAVFNSLFVLYNLKFTGLLRQNRRRITYFDMMRREFFEFGGTRFTGWNLGGGLLALETPGHSPDHLSFFHRGSGFLYIADIDIFLNPNVYHDGSVAELEDTIARLTNLVRSEGVTLLLGAHRTPIAGTNVIIAYLRDFVRKLAEVRRVVTGLIVRQDRWCWPDLMNMVFGSEHPALQEAVAVNWPRSTSNIDMYVHILLRELGYVPAGPRGRTWQRIREGAAIPRLS